ncbi:MAG: hypothetical protein JO069_07880 [Verrucomicrobia bacterium]|nr:hypothetical protein [Verrucomicrobiota bacterium]
MSQQQLNELMAQEMLLELAERHDRLGKAFKEKGEQGVLEELKNFDEEGEIPFGTEPAETEPASKSSPDAGKDEP